MFASSVELDLYSQFLASIVSQKMTAQITKMPSHFSSWRNNCKLPSIFTKTALVILCRILVRRRKSAIATTKQLLLCHSSACWQFVKWQDLPSNLQSVYPTTKDCWLGQQATYCLRVALLCVASCHLDRQRMSELNWSD